MNLYKCICLLILQAAFFNALAQENLSNSTKPSTKSNPKALLSQGDSLFVTVESYNQKMIVHKVRSGQTLYSISRFYGVSLSDLLFYNHGLAEKPLSIGQPLRIPIAVSIIARSRPANYSDSLFVPVIYKVKKGETLYRISRTYFLMDTDLMLENNHKTQPNLKIGDPMLIGWVSIYGAPDSLNHKTESSPLVGLNNNYRKEFFDETRVMKEQRQDGMAYWDKNEKPSGAPGLYALHRLAPINSIIRVYNPMSKRVLYLKVLGRIPDAGYEPQIILVVAPAAAKSLGAIDAKFHVKINYMK